MNEQRRFLNRMQPQTMVIATILLYLFAFFNVLDGLAGLPLFLLIGLAMGAGGFGIANEQRWGYSLALAGAGVNLALLVLFYPVLEFPFVIRLLFDGGLVLLLLHPETRDYQRIYFR